MPEGREPNWREILGSEIWREEIAPWIEEVRQATLESLAHSSDVTEFGAMQEVARKQGRVQALQQILDMPTTFMEMERLEAERRNEDNARKRGFPFPRRR
jgi:hypothetical protein